MSDIDRGPLTTYEIIWRSGHVEHINAHQVIWPNNVYGFDRGGTPRVLVHGEIDGRWQLLLAVDEADILSVRAVPVGAEQP